MFRYDQETHKACPLTHFHKASSGNYQDIFVFYQPGYFIFPKVSPSRHFHVIGFLYFVLLVLFLLIPYFSFIVLLYGII